MTPTCGGNALTRATCDRRITASRYIRFRCEERTPICRLRAQFSLPGVARWVCASTELWTCDFSPVLCRLSTHAVPHKLMLPLKERWTGHGSLAGYTSKTLSLALTIFHPDLAAS